MRVSHEDRKVTKAHEIWFFEMVFFVFLRVLRDFVAMNDEVMSCA